MPPLLDGFHTDDTVPVNVGETMRFKCNDESQGKKEAGFSSAVHRHGLGCVNSARPMLSVQIVVAREASSNIKNCNFIHPYYTTMEPLRGQP